MIYEKISLIFVVFLFLNNYKLAQSNQLTNSKKNLSFTIPTVLNEKDKKIYLEINKYQSKETENIDIKIKLLDNKILLGI